MERNVNYVQKSRVLHKGAKDLVRRAVEMFRVILENPVCTETIERSGRKAYGDAK